jgi:hypothetical protein
MHLVSLFILATNKEVDKLIQQLKVVKNRQSRPHRHPVSEGVGAYLHPFHGVDYSRSILTMGKRLGKRGSSSLALLIYARFLHSGVRREHMMVSTIRWFLTIALAALVAGAAFAQDGQDLLFPIGEDNRFHWEDLDAFTAMDLSGQELTILSPWVQADEDLVESILDYFEFATGADVIHTGSDSMEQQIVIDIRAGSPPNIAVFPQPGLAADMAAIGGLVPLGDDVADWMTENYSAGQSWVDLGTYPDENGED